MRHRKDWMNKATDPVLELLSEELVLNAVGAFYTLKHRSASSEDAPGRSTVYRAVETLEEHEYIEPCPWAESYYRITERGRAYLRGELDEC